MINLNAKTDGISWSPAGMALPLFGVGQTNAATNRVGKLRTRTKIAAFIKLIIT